MKVLSFNVRSWYRDVEADSPFYWIRRARAMRSMLGDMDADIICFQELLWPMTFFVPQRYRRVGLSISHHIYARKGLKTKRGRWRMHYVTCVCEGVNVASVHGRWESDRTDRLCKALGAWANGPSIAAGDFNVGVNALIKRNMPNSARIKLGLEPKPTFCNFKTGATGEIDHCLSWSMKPEYFHVIEDNYGVLRVSDHYPILIVFS